MLKILYKITLLAICSLTLALQSCQQSKEKKVPTEEELQREKERSQAGLRLGKMLNDRDFEQRVSQRPSVLFLRGMGIRNAG